MALPNRQPDAQPDLFEGAGPAHGVPASRPAERHRLAPDALDDAALVAALPHAELAGCRAVAAEAGRRRLVAAVPALEALCRRFKGFGLRHAVPEQIAALQGLAAIGGREAAAAVARLIGANAVEGPGLKEATGAASRLRARLPPDHLAALLRHADPGIREDACRCALPLPAVTTLLVDLLDDLHPAVAEAAACALGRLGRPEARPALSRLVQSRPTAEAVEAMAPVADATCVVLLGRMARTRPDLAQAVLDTLDDIDLPQAAAVARSLRANGRSLRQRRPA